MDKNLQHVYSQKLKRTKKALERNNMETFVVKKASDVVPLLGTLIDDGQTVSSGGSVTLDSCGVMDHLRKLDGEKKITFLDRDADGIDKDKLQRDAFSADVYFTSANAITENGELFAVDGTGNRVAAMAYGPARLIVIAGHNKVVKDLSAADDRRRRIAAPANTARLDLPTPCAKTGICSDCQSDRRICSIELVLTFQRFKDRIKVILVEEELGY